MKRWFPETNEFYIGYLPKSPDVIAGFIRKILCLLGIVVLCLACLLAFHQKQFSPANFEYGISSEIEGFIFERPVPHVLVPLGRDIHGKELHQTVLLVGSGKTGSENVVRELFAGGRSSGAKARLNGSLIYGDGKALLQVDDVHDIQLLDGFYDQVSGVQIDGEVSISGEIVDPKCYFGVMKPGEGKVHQSCAIRCIEGGIPPVFSSDSRGYYLLVDEDHKAVSTEVVGIVGDRITLHGKEIRWNDWTLLQVNSETIRQLSYAKKLKESLLAFEAGMTKCN